MLRLHDGKVSLWEQVLPAEVRLLSSELSAIDVLLDDDASWRRSCGGSPAGSGAPRSRSRRTYA